MRQEVCNVVEFAETALSSSCVGEVLTLCTPIYTPLEKIDFFFFARCDHLQLGVGPGVHFSSVLGLCLRQCS